MPAAVAATHAELSHLIARGDRKRAASLLVRDHAPAVLSLCRAMVRDPRLAEDLSQDAFARAFSALDGFRGEASPRTWLLRIARNRCLDHLDHVRRAPWARSGDPDPDDHAADEPPPYDLLARREDAERAMAVLGESERALVVLHFGHGVGYPELADSFGLREGAVRMRISRALARMRSALLPEPAFDDFELESEARTQVRASPDRAVLERAAGARLEEDALGASSDTLGRFSEDEDSLEVGAFSEDEDALEVGAFPGMVSDDALEEPAAALAEEPPEPLESLAEPWAPPTFSSLQDEVSSSLRWRLETLAAAL